jgi:capsule polysaccharide export protein KpsE/RkpR
VGADDLRVEKVSGVELLGELMKYARLVGYLAARSSFEATLTSLQMAPMDAKTDARFLAVVKQWQAANSVSEVECA